MSLKNGVRSVLLVAIVLRCVGAGWASARDDDLWWYLGVGPQPGGDGQYNQLMGMDWVPLRWARSSRQELSLGGSVTRLRSHRSDADNSLYAFSLFPQLTLTAKPWHGMTPLFLVRALGPTYLTERQLGERQQAMHFAFQAQVGGALRWRRHSIALWYRHYSNANLKRPNDGFDVPLVLAYGVTF